MLCRDLIKSPMKVLVCCSFPRSLHPIVRIDAQLPQFGKQFNRIAHGSLHAASPVARKFLHLYVVFKVKDVHKLVDFGVLEELIRQGHLDARGIDVKLDHN